MTAAGFRFDVVAAEVDETPHPSEKPEAYALRVARDKAAAVCQSLGDPASPVLAADTVVVAAGTMLLKPKDNADAARMLRLLSGTVHDVHTAVVLRWEAGERTDVVTTRVRFLPLGDAEIAWYIASGEPDGKAGAYAIQGRAARFIDWIEGSWSNVVGLPVAAVYKLVNGVIDVD